MSDQHPKHHCPSCGTAQSYKGRYPWHFCNSCLILAQDKAGKRLEFCNNSSRGGLNWRYHGDQEWRQAAAVACLIKSRPIIVHEARFGGVVAEPVRPSVIPDCNNLVDLRG